jgi:hypothetical protein
MDRWISIGCDREDKTSQRPFEPKYNWKVDQGTINGKIWKWNQMEKIERNGKKIKMDMEKWKMQRNGKGKWKEMEMELERNKKIRKERNGKKWNWKEESK